jgi:DNA-binding transcriptional MerR regulator
MASMPTPRDRGVYVISVAAELAGVHPQTLRLYERKGLLDPARTAGGSRRYSERDIERLRRIAELTASGLNLAGVRAVLVLQDEVRRLRKEVLHAQRVGGDGDGQSAAMNGPGTIGGRNASNANDASNANGGNETNQTDKNHTTDRERPSIRWQPTSIPTAGR